ncbi:ER membrane protein complex subunit 8/9 homolog [Asparagus officinalis]|uniref:ER membrane protein complex subunit 8/9 homolog n=1 Tax=Asparagus officinalis TaxID=4686 RepID=UPI00098E307B|nr:ER membrane protein complex subunit 8/9 homolog [Asparagus officinalis]
MGIATRTAVPTEPAALHSGSPSKSPRPPTSQIIKPPRIERDISYGSHHHHQQQQQPCNGLLVGRLSAGDDSTVQISDAVPLSHSLLGLLPSLELALHLVEEHFGAEGLSVVGYYHANERANDLELKSVAKNIGDHVFRCFPRAAVLLLDVEKMKELPKGKGRDPVVQVNKHYKYLNFEQWAHTS